MSDNDYVFLNGKAVKNAHEDHHHVTPLPMYWAVFGALLVLTVITYLVSFAGLGPGALPVAMIVAAIKASLVLAFFMHLASEDRFYLFLVITSIGLIGLFFGFIMFDVSASGSLNQESQVGTPRAYEQAKAIEDSPMPGEETEQAGHGGGDHAAGDGGEHGEGGH